MKEKEPFGRRIKEAIVPHIVPHVEMPILEEGSAESEKWEFEEIKRRLDVRRKKKDKAEMKEFIKDISQIYEDHKKGGEPISEIEAAVKAMEKLERRALGFERSWEKEIEKRMKEFESLPLEKRKIYRQQVKKDVEQKKINWLMRTIVHDLIEDEGGVDDFFSSLSSRKDIREVIETEAKRWLLRTKELAERAEAKEELKNARKELGKTTEKEKKRKIILDLSSILPILYF